MQPDTSLRILVVDDEPSVCRSVEKILTRRGCHVEWTLSVPGALDLLEGAGSFDLVLADLMMPQIGGLELLKVVRDRWPGLPVVIITGYASIASAVEATKLGALDYLPKPFTPDELNRVVAGAMSRVKARPAGAATVAPASGADDSRMIDVDMPFDEAEVEAATSPGYVKQLTRSDTVVVDFCALGQRTCRRYTTKGVCKTDECPIVAKATKRGQPVAVRPVADDFIDVDMPFSAREVAAATSEAYVAALGRGDAPVLGHWPSGRSAKPRILAVDDEAVVLHGIRRSLSRHGFVVDEAFSGHAALARVQAARYDLVLLDMRMPDGNGLDLLPKIKRRRPDLPVIIVTGYASIDTAVEAIQRGASDYVPKPFTPEELYQVTSRVLRRPAA